MPKHILVIEDDLATAEVIQRTLVYDEYTTRHAASGAEGLALARQEAFDLVVCDMHLGDLTGLEIQQELNADAATAHLPLLFLTAVREVEVVRLGLQQGAQLYITKPFSADELLDGVREALGR